jgi:hypothetical protein
MSKSDKVLVFIDDLGDPGFKLDRGSSEFFIISAVIFNDTLEAEKTAVAIKTLRRELGFSEKMEFKFNKSQKECRVKFLETVNHFNFKIRSIVFDKKILRSDELKNNKNSFYSYAIKSLLKYSGDSVLSASIKLDGSGDRAFKKSFLSYLRKSLNSREKKVVESFRFVDSKENVLVQLADMVAGSVRRSYDKDKTDKEVYKKIIRKHIENEWPFR